MHTPQECHPATLEAYLGQGFKRGVLLDAHLGCVRALRLVQHSPYPNIDRGHTLHFCIQDQTKHALAINKRLNRPVALWHCVGTRHYLRGPFLFRSLEEEPALRAVFRIDAQSAPLRLPGPAAAGEAGGEELRSKLELRWRRALDALGLEPQYEPCTFALPPPAGGSYTPDFSVRVAPFETSVFIEIKPAFPCNAALRRCARVAALGHPLLLLWGACAPPLIEEDPDRRYPHAGAARGWLFKPDGTHQFPVVFACGPPAPGRRRTGKKDAEEVRLATWSPTLTGWDHPRVRAAFAAAIP